MYCRIPLTKPILKVVWYIKWASTNAVKKEFQKEIKEWYRKTSSLWATWYFVSSVWEINWEIIAQYVENQWQEENYAEEIEL